MKIKIPKVEYVEKEVYSEEYEKTIECLKALKEMGLDITYNESFTETGWEIIATVDSKLAGYVYKGDWEERRVYYVQPIPMWSSRMDVEPILDKIYDIINDFGNLTVSDLYEVNKYFDPTFICDEKFTDNKYGWTKTNQLRIIRKREGYTIGYDDPELLV